MNVVGRVGSLISQGVYSVATPFHPFGGAVDVIAVQQKDGTFRSTPWYVRFGKFQGVIKGAEKIVRITVNGSEANFHMYLDNSGEAYFVREVDSGKGSDTGGGVLEDDTPYEDANDYSNDNGLNHNAGVCRLQHSVSDTGVSKLRDEFGGKRIGRSESEGNRRYYDFQDDQSSLQDSGELSTRYDNLDAEHLGESKPSDSEVILVSVDGHVLTAPITASEQSSDDVKLDTPQFHLGPGDGDEFCEGTGEITSGGGAWGGDYITNLNSSATSDASDTNNDLCHQLEVCEEADEDVGSNEGDHDMHSDSDDASGKIRKGDVFKSCLELGDLSKHVDNVDDEETGPILEAPPTQQKWKKLKMTMFIYKILMDSLPHVVLSHLEMVVFKISQSEGEQL